MAPRQFASIYPPLSIAGFALVAKVSATVLAMKLWIVLHDVALVGLLMAWMAARGRGAFAAIAYAWNPLVLIEYAGSGHNDPTAMVWLIAAYAIVFGVVMLALALRLHGMLQRRHVVGVA